MQTPSLQALLVVGIGGSLGSMSRYGMSLLWTTFGNPGGFPWATLCVNLLGCLGAGVVLGLLPPDPTPARLFWLTGILGGFTTFSAFGLETVQLWLNHQRLAASLNVSANLLGSLLMVVLGWWMTARS